MSQLTAETHLLENVQPFKSDVSFITHCFI